MEEEKTMEENFDLFLKLINDLASIRVTISDEDQAIQLLSSLPQAYEPLVHTLQYGTWKDTLTVSEVMASAYSKEVELKGCTQRLEEGRLQEAAEVVTNHGKIGTRGKLDQNQEAGQLENQIKHVGSAEAIRTGRGIVQRRETTHNRAKEPLQQTLLRIYLDPWS